DALAGEVLGLGEEHHLPRQRHRAEEMVGERQVVADQDDGTAAGHVLAPARPGAEYHLQRDAKRVLGYPVEHTYIVARPAGFAAAVWWRSGAASSGFERTAASRRPAHRPAAAGGPVSVGRCGGVVTIA